MESRKGFTAFGILIVILTILLITIVILSKDKYYASEAIKVSTYTDREIYIDLKTLEPIKNQPTTSNTLRVEFLDIEGDNNWIEIIGDIPETFADRFATAKAIAVLKGIVTKEELELLKTKDIQNIENILIVKLKNNVKYLGVYAK